jgi:hypothetical protein
LGTSTSHGSPRDPSVWRALRALYEGAAPPSQIASAIANALSDEHISTFVAPEVLQPVTELIFRDTGADVERLLECWSGRESVAIELARIAALRTTFLASDDALERVRLFSAEYAVAITEHLVARDLEELVGGSALPNVAAMNDLVEAVGNEVRQAVMGTARPIEMGSITLKPERLVAGMMLEAFGCLRTRGGPGA